MSPWLFVASDEGLEAASAESLFDAAITGDPVITRLAGARKEPEGAAWEGPVIVVGEAVPCSIIV